MFTRRQGHRAGNRAGGAHSLVLDSGTVPAVFIKACCIQQAVVIVRDLSASLRSYRDGPGLEELRDRQVEGDGPGLLDAPAA